MTFLAELKAASPEVFARIGEPTPALPALSEGKWDNRPSWDSGPRWDSRPSWDNWSKSR
jgi:hypothetical protein